MSGKRILALFDVDGTLTVPRGDATEEVLQFLQALRSKITVGIVGGSDLIKQEEQLGRNITKEVDYSFSENGLVAYKNGELIGKEVHSICLKALLLCHFLNCNCVQAIHTYLGEENIKALVNFILHYIADLDIPVKRCNFFILVSSAIMIITSLLSFIQRNIHRIPKWYDKCFSHR